MGRNFFSQNYLHCWDCMRVNLPTYTTFTSFENFYPSGKKFLCNDMNYEETMKTDTMFSNSLRPYSRKLGHHINVTDTTSSLASESEVLYHHLYGISKFYAYTYSYDDTILYSSTIIN